ncbi:hypothetical protein DXT99_25360 [Pontibacter diazotrophicus]|uniref:Uncharacterized protein n=1 Tax=Pontibacter diazotrophicus TaxID=1400979 RepID=A0A3D8L101_9BACT|nr:hypothetical protein [Pontibacter diazotrophicus]RDV11098.1 hypothetical protein DXT99_25360 [Pontibacter diazotrophicus]
MITLVNFADSGFRTQQRWNSLSGTLIGGFDEVIEFSPSDLDSAFRKEADEMIKQSTKGYGNYCWKSYIINKALEVVKEGDFLFYADSGSIFINSVKPLIKVLERSGKNIMCFSLALIEKQWTKRDAFILMGCDEKRFLETAQIMGGFLLIKKGKESVNFCKEFQQLSLDSRIISDQQNIMGKKNYPGFISHRHDQSILSLMAKKYDVLILNDPSDYGIFPERILHNDNFLFDPERMNPSNNTIGVKLLSNRKVHPLIYLLKYIMRISLLKLGVSLSKKVKNRHVGGYKKELKEDKAHA